MCYIYNKLNKNPIKKIHNFCSWSLSYFAFLTRGIDKKNHELGIYIKICNLWIAFHENKIFRRINFHCPFSLHWKYSVKAVHWHNIIVYPRFPFLQIIQRLHLLNISWGKNQIMQNSKSQQIQSGFIDQVQSEISFYHDKNGWTMEYAIHSIIKSSSKLVYHAVLIIQ